MPREPWLVDFGMLFLPSKLSFRERPKTWKNVQEIL